MVRAQLPRNRARDSFVASSPGHPGFLAVAAIVLSATPMSFHLLDGSRATFRNAGHRMSGSPRKRRSWRSMSGRRLSLFQARTHELMQIRCVPDSSYLGSVPVNSTIEADLLITSLNALLSRQTIFYFFRERECFFSTLINCLMINYFVNAH